MNLLIELDNHDLLSEFVVAEENIFFLVCVSKQILKAVRTKFSNIHTNVSDILATISILRWVLEMPVNQRPKLLENGLKNKRVAAYLAKRGYLEVLKWARENGCDWDYSTC